MKTARTCRSANVAGFTLIELLVAIAVLGISMSLVYGVFLSVFGVVDHVEKTAAYQERVNVLFTQLHRDIAGLYKGSTGFLQADADVMKSDGTPFLQFTTTSALRFGPHRISGPAAAVGYLLQRSGNGLNYNLYRIETPFLFGFDSGLEKTKRPLLVCEHIRDFQITYTDQYDGDLDLWRARSSSTREKPEDDLFPTAIQVEMELAEGPHKDAETRRFHYSIFVRPAQLKPPDEADRG